jgi:VWA domain-containing protein
VPLAVDLGFASPLGALIALAALLPLVAFVAVRSRARGVRRALRLPEPTGRSRHVPLLGLGAAAVLLGLAATQPVLQRNESRLVRSDAEAWVVLDTTRSMLAQRNPDSPTRLERAKAAAQEVRDTLPNVPVGIASLTDRVLPHLFPSPDEEVFRATLERSLGIERPPPRSGLLAQVTRIDSVGAFSTLNFFRPEARRRVIVVLTDGESLPFSATRTARRLSRPPPIGTVLVHVWDSSERVYTRGVPEPQYRPDSTSRSALDELARATGGRVYTEDEAGSAAAKARQLIGRGPTVDQGERRVRYALSAYLAAAAFLPFGLLLWRRDR